MATNSDDIQAQIDGLFTGISPDLSTPPGRDPAEQKRLDEARKLSGIPAGPLEREGLEYAPQRFMAAQVKPLTGNPEVDFADAEEIAKRFFQPGELDAIMNSNVYYMPRPELPVDLKTKEKRDPRLLLAPTQFTDQNFQVAAFPKGLTKEQRATLLVKSGAYRFGTEVVPREEGENPLLSGRFFDSSRTVAYEPSYVTALREQRTEQDSYTYAWLNKVTPKLRTGQGKIELSNTLTRMGVENPANQAALLAAEDVGEFEVARGAAAGYRSFSNFIEQMLTVNNQRIDMEEFDEFSSIGRDLNGIQPSQDNNQFLQLISIQAQADAVAMMDAQPKGMTKTFTNPETGERITFFNPEYKNDYVGALVAEGYDAEAAENFWQYNETVYDKFMFLAGEEAIPFAVSGFLRGALALGGSAAFASYLKKTYEVSDVDELIKKGYNPAQLLVAYTQSMSDTRVGRFFSSFALDSARIMSLSNRGFGGLSAQKAMEAGSQRIQTLGREINNLRLQRAQLLGKRTDSSIQNEIKRIDAQIALKTKDFRTAHANNERYLDRQLNGNWAYQNLKSFGYGATGAALLGTLHEQHFPDSYSVLSDMLGFIGGASAISYTKRGIKGLAIGGMIFLDDISTGLGSNIGFFQERLFKDKLEWYDDFDTLKPDQKFIVEQLANLSPAQLQGARASAMFVNSLQEKLRGVTDDLGNPIFTEDFLEQTLGVVTGLNLLRLAELQIGQKISIGQLGKLDGEEFYMQEAFLGRSAELSMKLETAINTLTGAGATDPEIAALVTGLRSLHNDAVERINVNARVMMSDLENRRGDVKGLLVGDEEVYKLYNVTSPEQVPGLIEALLKQEDDLFMKAQAHLGIDVQQSLRELEKRVTERGQELADAAKHWQKAIGATGVYENGPANLAMAAITNRASLAYQKGVAGYANIPNDVHMDAEPIYRHLREIEASQASKREAGQEISDDLAGNWDEVFEGAATRALVSGGVDNDDISEIGSLLSLSPSAGSLGVWEELKKVASGKSKISKTRLLKVAEKVGGLDPESVKNLSDDAQIKAALDAIDEFQDLDLPIDIAEFKNLNTGVNVRVRNTFQKNATGVGAYEERQLWELMHEMAVDPVYGFKRNYFVDPTPADDAYQALIDANEAFRVEFADRFLRGGPNEKLLKGRGPRPFNPSAPTPKGAVEASKTLKVITGDLEGVVNITGDTAQGITNNLARAVGERIPEGGINVRSAVNPNGNILPEGQFFIREGSKQHEELSNILTMRLAERIYYSPAATAIRNAGRKYGTQEMAEREKALLAGKVTKDVGSQSNRDMIESYKQIKVLRENADGTFTEVPLINEDALYDMISLENLQAADNTVRAQVVQVSRDIDKAVDAAKEINMTQRNIKLETWTSVGRAIESLNQDPATFFQRQFDQGDLGLGDVETVRSAIVSEKRLELDREVAAGRMTQGELEAEVLEAAQEFDEIRNYQFGVWIRKNAIGDTTDIKPVLDPVTGQVTSSNVKTMKSSELLKMLGADANTPEAMKRKQVAIDALGGDIERYEQLVATAQWGILETRKNPQGIALDGIPTGLSIESWISRVYSINRGVVSPRYVAAEAMINAFRQQGVDMLQVMITDKKFAAKVIKILESERPLSDAENFEFVQIGVSALSMYLAREVYNEDTTRLDVEVRITDPSVETQVIETQMLDLGA